MLTVISEIGVRQLVKKRPSLSSRCTAWTNGTLALSFGGAVVRVAQFPVYAPGHLGYNSNFTIVVAIGGPGVAVLYRFVWFVEQEGLRITRGGRNGIVVFLRREVGVFVASI